MRERLKRCESLLWLFMKLCLYILLMAVFMLLLSIENKPLLRLSRTMGTSVITFVVVGLLFLSIYGKFDVGRRKSKPIIYSPGNFYFPKFFAPAPCNLARIVVS